MTVSTTTRLQAVNNILSSAGQPAIADLVTGLTPDSALAGQILDEQLISILSNGWYFNTREVTYTPSGGRVNLGATVLNVDVDDYGMSAVTIRNGYLYDLVTGTDTAFIYGDVTFKIVEAIEWTDLPEAARQYVYKSAAREFCDRHVNDPNLSRTTRQAEAEALSRLQRAECAAGNFRIFNSRDLAVVDRGGPLDWVRS